MAPFICIFVFLYGVMERDFWWALLTATAAFFFCFFIEVFYACWMFAAMLEVFSKLISFF